MHCGFIRNVLAHIVQELLPFLQPLGVPLGVPPPYDGIFGRGVGGGGVVVSKCDDADDSENSAVSRVVFVVSVIDAELWRDWG